MTDFIRPYASSSSCRVMFALSHHVASPLRETTEESLESLYYSTTEETTEESCVH